ncbi:MAG TPA: M48 family metalloprotease [Methylomirabilota bacterium]|nr:M48 family metalloprotease [Methylomirabilota bacterium]
MARWAAVPLFVLAIFVAGCAGLPAGTYYPPPGDPNTLRVANTLHRAAVAAGDDPARYTFALIKTRHPTAFTDEDATFYFSDGLARMPTPVLQAVIAHEVAHEVLDHIGTRRRMAVGMTGGFGAAGLFVPGVGLLDFMVNPLVVRAFSRKQELAADQRAVEILRDMGEPTPRRSLAEALRAVDEAPVRSLAGAGGALDIRPSLKERLSALEPLEPLPVAEAAPKP